MQHHSHPRFIRISTREKYVFFLYTKFIYTPWIDSISDPTQESSSHGHLVVYTCLHCNSSKSIPAPPTLNPALATGTGTGTEGSTESSGFSLTLAAPPSHSQVQKEEKKKQKKPTFSSRRPHPRPLPLFARPDAGHVVFRGNEVLDQQGG